MYIPLPTVLSDEVALKNGKIGVLTLNNIDQLHALTAEMIDLLRQSLDTWQNDNDIVAVMIFGDGHKAFCAGGDVRSVRENALLEGGEYSVSAEAFFEAEYRLDYLIHRYSKPVVVWGEGIVLGGGLGLLAGASHRVLTPSSRLAMPEVSIALYPDVGASYFLNKMPGRVGYFLALTGSLFTAADAIYVGLGDYCLANDSRARFIEYLHQADWVPVQHSGSNESNALLLSEILTAMQISAGSGWLEKDQAEIDQLCAGDDGLAMIQRVLAYQGDSQTILRAIAGLKKGSPLSSRIIVKQLLDSRDKSLPEVFRSELVLSTNMVSHGEFQEGVRALLVDKDKQPKWQYKNAVDVPQQEIDKLFTAQWNSNALESLV